MGLGHSQFSGDLSQSRSHRHGKDTGCSVEPRTLELCYSSLSPQDSRIIFQAPCLACCFHPRCDVPISSLQPCSCPSQPLPVHLSGKGPA